MSVYIYTSLILVEGASGGRLLSASTQKGFTAATAAPRFMQVVLLRSERVYLFSRSPSLFLLRLARA